MKMTIEQIRDDWGACYWDDEEEPHELASWVEENLPATPLQIARWDDIPVQDRLWVLLREEIIPAHELHELACRFAESVLHMFEDRYPDDKRPRRAIEAKRAWLRGEIGDDELSTANEVAVAVAKTSDRGSASAAAWAASSAAYWDAASVAAWDAANEAAMAAARDVARDVARDADAARDPTWTADATRDAALDEHLKLVVEVLKGTKCQ